MTLAPTQSVGARIRRGASNERERVGGRSSVLLVALARGHLRGLDEPAGELLAFRIEVQPARRLLNRRVVADEVGVENVAGVRRALEPVDVVFVIGDR